MNDTLPEKSMVFVVTALFINTAIIIPSSSGDTTVLNGFFNENENNTALTDSSARFYGIKSSVPSDLQKTIYVDDDNTEGPWDGTKEHPYQFIQDGINAATDGDAVFVYNGTYYENVVVNKTIELIGEDRKNTIIKGNYEGNVVVLISTNKVGINGFTIKESGHDGAGVEIRSNYNTITNNIISRNYFGFYLNSCSNNIISGNNISNNLDGIYLRDSSNNNIIGNNINENTWCGIKLEGSSNNNINNNNIVSNDIGGIRLDHSDNNNILDNSFFNDGLFVLVSYQNTVSNNTVNGKPLIYLERESDIIVDSNAGQVILVRCDNVTVQNQNISKTIIGIQLVYTNNCLIKGNNITNNRDGIDIHEFSYNNIISGNNITNNKGGIDIHESSYNTVSGNNITSNNYYGICLSGSSNNNNITGNSISNSYYGIYLHDSTYNNIISGNNIISNNRWSGIYLHDSSYNIISGNNITSNNEAGIYLDYSRNNNILGNNITSNNYHGIWLSSSSNNNNITGNSISNNYYGIYLDYSRNNIITDNSFLESGLVVSSSYQNVVNNNTVNHKPLIYLEGESNIIVDSNAGQVILVRCDNVTVQNQNISKTIIGIQLVYTNNCLIKGNNITNNRDGIDIHESSYNNIISGNNITNNKGGIDIHESSYNTVSGNNITNNRDGIDIHEFSNHNIVSGNNITNNEGGIDIHKSSNNTISGNNIISNNREGIGLYDSWGNSILGNTISNNDQNGIFISTSYNNDIYRNNIARNEKGIYDIRDFSRFEKPFPRNNIFENNFVNNKIHATWWILFVDYIFHGGHAGLSKWYRNYWGQIVPSPYFIRGVIGIETFSAWYSKYIEIPSIVCDWHPAKEPYDIS